MNVYLYERIIKRQFDFANANDTIMFISSMLIPYLCFTEDKYLTESHTYIIYWHTVVQQNDVRHFCDRHTQGICLTQRYTYQNISSYISVLRDVRFVVSLETFCLTEKTYINGFNIFCDFQAHGPEGPEAYSHGYASVGRSVCRSVCRSDGL